MAIFPPAHVSDLRSEINLEYRQLTRQATFIQLRNKVRATLQRERITLPRKGIIISFACLWTMVESSRGKNQFLSTILTSVTTYLFLTYIEKRRRRLEIELERVSRNHLRILDLFRRGKLPKQLPFEAHVTTNALLPSPICQRNLLPYFDGMMLVNTLGVNRSHYKVTRTYLHARNYEPLLKTIKKRVIVLLDTTHDRLKEIRKAAQNF